jgi:hypothetical protein
MTTIIVISLITVFGATFVIVAISNRDLGAGIEIASSKIDTLDLELTTLFHSLENLAKSQQSVLDQLQFLISANVAFFCFFELMLVLFFVFRAIKKRGSK